MSQISGSRNQKLLLSHHLVEEYFILLIDEGMGSYHFYSAETSDIRRAQGASGISIDEAEWKW